MGGAPRDLSIDLAVVGAGAAGTAVAHAMRLARPDWTIRLFERSDRIGGRLRSVRVEGLDHPKRMFDLTEGLIRRKYTDSQIEGILGGNFVRVLSDLWKV